MFLLRMVRILEPLNPKHHLFDTGLLHHSQTHIFSSKLRLHVTPRSDVRGHQFFQVAVQLTKLGQDLGDLEKNVCQAKNGSLYSAAYFCYEWCVTAAGEFESHFGCGCGCGGGCTGLRACHTLSQLTHTHSLAAAAAPPPPPPQKQPPRPRYP